MDYSNFVRNFFRKATSALQNYYQYNGKIVELSFDLDIPSELHYELMGNVDSKIKVKVLLAQALF